MATTPNNSNLGRDFVVPDQYTPDGNSIVTGKPRVSNLDIFNKQQAEVTEPNWDWEPNVADGSKVADKKHTPNKVTLPVWDTPEDFKRNMANIWVPNPEDLTPAAPVNKQQGVKQSDPRDESADYNWNPIPEAEDYVAPSKPKGQKDKQSATTDPGWNWNPIPDAANYVPPIPKKDPK